MGIKSSLLLDVKMEEVCVKKKIIKKIYAFIDFTSSHIKGKMILLAFHRMHAEHGRVRCIAHQGESANCRYTAYRATEKKCDKSTLGLGSILNNDFSVNKVQ